MGLKSSDCKLGQIVYVQEKGLGRKKKILKGEIINIVGNDVFVHWYDVGVYSSRENPAEFLPPPEEMADDMAESYDDEETETSEE